MKQTKLFLGLFMLMFLATGVFWLGNGGDLLLRAQHPDLAKIQIDPANLKMFSPLPTDFGSEKILLTEEKINLGRMLYYDARLSKDGTVSCNSCHDLSQYGTDRERVSTGFKKQLGSRNAPTVYNAADQIAQFWDGRAADVEEQAKGPVMNPVEMAMPNAEAVVERLKSIPGYVEAFQRAFPSENDPVTYDNMGKTIGAFERKLMTPSPWDRFLKGDSAALSNEEKIGFNRFVETGCQMCHNGVYVGGSMFMKLGTARPWPDTRDLGRFQVTHQEADKMKFKVPTLRNITNTAPYFHDGSVASLDQAVKDMAEFQLGKTLTRDDVRSIVAWLGALTGSIPADYIKLPELPKSAVQEATNRSSKCSCWIQICRVERGQNCAFLVGQALWLARCFPSRAFRDQQTLDLSTFEHFHGLECAVAHELLPCKGNL